MVCGIKKLSKVAKTTLVNESFVCKVTAPASGSATAAVCQPAALSVALRSLPFTLSRTEIKRAFAKKCGLKNRRGVGRGITQNWLWFLQIQNGDRHNRPSRKG